MAIVNENWKSLFQAQKNATILGRFYFSSFSTNSIAACSYIPLGVKTTALFAQCRFTADKSIFWHEILILGLHETKAIFSLKDLVSTAYSQAQLHG